MLPLANWRLIAILALIAVACLAVVYPADGQEFGTARLFDLASVSDAELASLLAAAEPSPAPPGASTQPPSLPEITPSQPDEAAPLTTTETPSELPSSLPLSPMQTRSATSSMLASRSPMIRLAGLPNMFGDSFGPQVGVFDFAGGETIDVPPPGGTRRMKIAENDKALPMDRVFFTYNHFQNAIEATAADSGVESYPIDQYTLGVEKTFRDGLWSVEMRLPFSRTPQTVGTNLAVDNGDVGNLSVTVKRLLFATRTTAVGVGLPVETPTGSDVSGEGTFSRFTLSNDAVHLAPFVGFLTAPNDRVFCEGFLQVDLPLGGNRVTFGDADLGTLTEQDLLYVDLAMGYWLFHDPCSRSIINGMAAVVEYHYTTTLEDAETVSGTDGNQLLRFGNSDNRIDVSNVTIGLHTEMGKTTLRVGGVFPLGSGSNRFYDGEVSLSLNRQF